MKPKVICFSFLVEPLPPSKGGDVTDDNEFGCAIEDAVDEFRASLRRHGLKLLDEANGGDHSEYVFTDHYPERPYPSRHALLSPKRKKK